MPWHRIINVPALEKIVWEDWPELGTNQFMSRSDDRLRVETQNRLPGQSTLSAGHLHRQADTIHIILEGEGEYIIAPDVWVPARPGDIFLTRGGDVHGGRCTNPEKPLKYLVIEGPAPETIEALDGTPITRFPGEDSAATDGELRIAANGGVVGTNVLLAGATDRPVWMDRLPDGSFTD
jgi:mannose-6-phosphate isomerase-like protein (cupin superfamily)